MTTSISRDAAPPQPPSGVAGGDDDLQVHGALMLGYAQACKNLNIVAGHRAASLIADLSVERWYPLARWHELERVVLGAYKSADAILVKVGVEMMMGWYHFGPGRQLIARGADFLEFQTGSNGFQSVVRGPRERVGDFALAGLDRAAGRAVVHSTTPFNRKMECGVLIGGILAPGDVDYVDVTNDADPDRLIVEFH